MYVYSTYFHILLGILSLLFIFLMLNLINPIKTNLIILHLHICISLAHSFFFNNIEWSNLFCKIFNTSFWNWYLGNSISNLFCIVTIVSSNRLVGKVKFPWFFKLIKELQDIGWSELAIKNLRQSSQSNILFYLEAVNPA